MNFYARRQTCEHARCCGDSVLKQESKRLVPRVWSAIALILAVAMPGPLSGQDPDETATSFHDRVVDQIVLKDGPRIRGCVTSEKPTKTLVRTEWLRKELPDFFAVEIQPALQNATEQPNHGLEDMLQKEILRLEAMDEQDAQRVGLLREIRNRLIPEEGDLPPYVILEIPKARIRRVDLQPPTRRELCRLAILNEVPDYELLSSKAVTTRLQAIPQNARRVSPPAAVQAPLLFERILAATDVQLGTASRFVQSGDTVIDESDEVDPAALLTSMLGQNLQSTLSDLLNEGSRPPTQPVASETLPDAARRMADAKNQRSIVLSSFDFDLTGGRATVHRRLFHRNSDGTWNLVLSSTGNAQAADVKPGQTEVLQQDPQVKQMAAAIEALGIGDAQLSTALNMGAVVQNALNQAEQVFQTSVLEIIAARDVVRSQEVATLILNEQPLARQ